MDKVAYKFNRTLLIREGAINPLEKAEKIQKSINENGYTHKEASKVFGIARSEVSNLLRLLKLDERVKALLAQGHLSEAHGKILSGLPVARQFEFANRAVSKKWSSRTLQNEIKGFSENASNDGIELRQLEDKLSEYLLSPVRLKWRTKHPGVLKIHFSNLDVLDGILDKIGFRAD